MQVVCEGCGTPFQAKTVRAKRCKKNCGRVRSSESANGARTRKRQVTQFIGVDGEGVTREDGTHDYVLLSVGNESLYRPDGGRLTWREIFPFLWGQFTENPNAAFVGYYLGYDFTQWLRGLPESRARLLFTKAGIASRSRKDSGGNPMPFPVHVGEWEWEIEMLGLKRFLIRPGLGHAPHPKLKNNHPWMAICDVGSFFQQSFLKTIKEWAGTDTVSDTEYAIIAEGKQMRATAVFDKAMIRYNILENEILARIMPALNTGFQGVGIALNRKQWFGPGQAAQGWLRLIGAPTAEEVKEAVPVFARDAGRMSYYGGWFEIFRHGTVPGTTYEYDINSAYPYVISELPCLLHGEWSHVDVPVPVELAPRAGTLRVLHGHAKGSNGYIGTLPHRTAKGSVLRPLETSGWYWEHEVNAAKTAGLVDEFLVDEYVQYEKCGCPPPLRAIADLYLERLTVGKNTPHGKAFKLIYNSAYGKMAQSIGSPKFANPIYASLITAGCRTMILDAIATHPVGAEDVMMIATDGIYFRSPHTALKLSGSELGAWDGSTKENLTLFMPGLYWDDESRKRVKEGADAKLKSRGVPAADLATRILDIDTLFAEMCIGDSWPRLEIPINFSMVSPGQALARNKWETCGSVTQGGMSKVLSADPSTKRVAMASDDKDSRILRTFPYYMGKELESTPYDRHFGDEMANAILNDEVMTPEGLITILLPELLHG